MDKYYSILELNINGSYTVNDINTAFRKLARIWHPDKNINNINYPKEKIKELIEARDILINNISSTQSSTNNTNDIINITVSCTLEELYYGVKKKINIFINDKCNCITQWPNADQMLCAICNNTRIIKVNKIYICNIKPGNKHDSIIVLSKLGNYNNNTCNYDDIHLHINELKHPKYIRNENNLHYYYNVNLCNSLSGTVIKFKHLDGSEIVYYENEIIYNGCYRIIKNKGMSFNDNNYGDLYIFYNIKYPNKPLSDEQKHVIKSIFGEKQIIKPLYQYNIGKLYNKNNKK